jgi:CDP-diacylglycerol--serine O-phosphatidyltransferase
MEEIVARILWRRRSGLRRRHMVDNPRPAGGQRWTGRLRRGSGKLARRVLRVRHRRTTAAAHTSRAPVDVELPVAPAPEPEPRPVRLLPGARSLARQFRFVLVTSCTLVSLSLGVLAILLAMRGEVRLAAFCLIGCVVFDGLDGALARRLGVASPFGAQMDSLADMCAFGIAAPVVVYASSALERSSVASDAVGVAAGNVPGAAAAVACALVAGCAAIRLARFNISPKDGRFFTGVPTTMAAAVLAVAVLLDLPLPPTALLVGVAMLAFAMVSSFPYATLTRLLRLPPWLWLVPLAGALVDARLTFVALVGAYLVSGPVVWFRHRAMGVVPPSTRSSGATSGSTAAAGR